MIINVFGDIALHHIDHKNFRLSVELRNLLAESDLNVANFECPITESTNKTIDHPVHLKCSADTLKVVEGFHAFSLANNHLLDYDADGVLDTLSHLQERKIDFFGGGISQDEALKPLTKSFGKIKVALIGATRFAYANKNSPGAAKDSLRHIKKTVKKLKRENCFVIIYFHWGYEYVPYPAPRERRMAHKCIDFGADLIVGSHPHIMQGFERYKDKYIFYSLGNFIFASKVFDGLAYRQNDPRLFKSFALRLHLSATHEYAFQLLPYQTSDQRIELLCGTDKDELLEELDQISAIFNAGYFAYLKKYFHYAAEISNQNRKIRHNYTLKDKRDLLSLIRTYARANYQDVLNRIVGALWRGNNQ